MVFCGLLNNYFILRKTIFQTHSTPLFVIYIYVTVYTNVGVGYDIVFNAFI